jgi:hypothetical protein
MTFVHFLAEIKEIALGGIASGILYNFLFKVIITLRGLDSYTTWNFHKYGCPKRTLKKFEGGNITQYLLFEGLDVVCQATLLDDGDVTSLVEPSNGVGLRVWHCRQGESLENLY